MFVRRTALGLLTACAVCSIYTPAEAAENGLESNDEALIANPVDGLLEGDLNGLLSTGVELNLDNQGTIRGLNTAGGFWSPTAGVLFTGGPGNITNSGEISGRFGISTFYHSADQENGIFDARAIGSTLINSGTITGQNDDGVRFIGGGTVTNSGSISGMNAAGADGISMFTYNGQTLESGAVIGSVQNQVGGTISGNRFGIILSNGGAVTNAGTISGNAGSIAIQALPSDAGRVGNVNNSGTLNGTVSFTDLASASVENSGSITGASSGILDSSLQFTVNNSGTIEGNGINGFASNTDAGIAFNRGAASITNSGTITGARFGVSSFYYYSDPDNNVWDGRAIGSTINNSGSIIGESDDGVRLIGGGTVTNSGTIVGQSGSLTDGISMFAYTGQNTTGLTSIGTVHNLLGGLIQGNRFAVILSGGGTVDNAGTLTGGTNGALLIQGPVGIGTVSNSGTINGNLRFNGLQNVDLVNSGTIVGGVSGSAVLGDGPMSLNNTGSITGSASGYFSSGATLAIDNAGTIRGNGNSTDFNAPNGGVLITGGPATVNNSGTISGQRFGLTTFGYQLQSGTNNFQGRAINVTVNNSGSIIGDNDDGVRLIGGGTVTNSGYIAGRLGAGADGISMFAHNDQSTVGFTSIGTVTNLATGLIDGNRIGVILSNGGTVANAGIIRGNNAAISIQSLVTDSGKLGIVSNSGIIEGAVRFTGSLAAAQLTNSGSVTTTSSGTAVTSERPLVASNASGAFITGAASGILAQGTTFDLDNAGTIRGNGNSTDFNAPNAGVLITGGPATVTNSGTISGQRFGLSTFGYQLQSGVNDFEARAFNVTVNNGGSIIGDNDDGVRLIGGGTVTNSGYIAGRASAGADGVSMFRHDGQAIPLAGIGTVNNLSGATIDGKRLAIILSGGGAVNNAGTLNGGTNGAITIQGPNAIANQGLVNNSGLINGRVSFHELVSAALNNSGTIAGSTSVTSVTDAVITNSGTIAGANDDAISSTSKLTIDNQLGGSITSLASGIFDHGPGLSLTNAGTINGNGDIGVAFDGAPAAISNSGIIYGNNAGIAAFGSGGGTAVNNSGTIQGDNAYGISLISGSVTNSGSILGPTWGILIQSNLGFVPTVTNLAGGTISSIGLDSGGSVNNAGTIGVLNSSHDAIQFASGGSGGAVSLVNSGVINGNVLSRGQNPATIVNSGTMQHAPNNIYSVLFTEGATTLTNAGSILGAVTTSNFADTVTLKQGSTISGLLDLRQGTDILRLEGTVNAHASATKLTNTLNIESVQVTGGYWVTNGFYTDIFSSVSIGNGTLQVDPGLATALYSPVAVNAGGTLAGSGFILGNVTVNSGGILAPAGRVGSAFSPIATLSTKGNVIFNSGSTFSVQTAPNGTSDRFSVDGAVTINQGALLQVLAGIATYPASGTSYVVLTATGGIAGKFEKAVTDYNYFNVAVNTQKKGTITVQITPNGKPLPSAATVTTLGAATAVESLGENNPLYLGVLNQSLAGARLAFDSLSGSSYARFDGILADGFGRMRLGVKGTSAGASSLQWTDRRPIASEGFHSGAVKQHGDISLMMLGGSYGSRISAGQVTAEVATRFAATAAGYRSGRIEGLASVSTAWHEIDASRIVAFPAFADAGRARYSMKTHRVDAEIGYAVSRGSVGILPYGGYSHIATQSGAIRELGGFSALSIAPERTATNQLRAGVRAEVQLSLGRLSVVPRVDASLTTAWGELDGGRQAAFVTGSRTFDSVGAAFNRREAALDAGVELRAGGISFNAGYQGRAGTEWSDHKVTLGAGFRF